MAEFYPVGTRGHGLPDFVPQEINIKLQSVGVYLMPAWAALVGVNKNFLGGILNVGFGSGTTVAYIVPASKVLYITQFALRATASVPANGDLNQFVVGSITEFPSGATLLYLGGNGGAAMTFSTPIPINDGHEVRFFVACQANHNLNVWVSAGGYEV
ncbi:unnamed protein product [marine sediment metagenome]|uniref:Uncharacterized protein n=1 Tax=marine sediment metagenome TaxID=412755 RepID=X1KAT4_9ZZZZ